MFKRTALAISIVFGLGACANVSESQRNAGIGAVGGAVGGAVIGSATGSDKVGRDAAIGAGIGALGAYIWSQRMEAQRQAMAEAAAGSGVDVSRTEDNQLKLDIPSDVSFDVGKAVIRPEMRPILSRFAETLHQNPATTVRIIGHTDSTGTPAGNAKLSIDRANAVAAYLIGHGVLASRLQASGRGQDEPIASNANEMGRAQNRRVEIFVRPPNS